jgi:hypothetical protein
VAIEAPAKKRVAAISVASIILILLGTLGIRRHLHDQATIKALQPRFVERPANIPRSSLQLRLVVPSPQPNGHSFRDEDGTRLFLDNSPVATQDDVSKVVVAPGLHPNYVTYIYFTPTAAKRLRAFTSANIGSRLAIVVDDQVLLAPEITDEFSSAATIFGPYSEADMTYLAERLAP